MSIRHFTAKGIQAIAAGIARKARGMRRYEGSAAEICEQITRRCWDERRGFFCTSPTTYPEFWARDFGRCAAPLLELGFTREVGSTFRYALRSYEAAARFALTIAPSGAIYDFPAYAPDGFALFLHGLNRLEDRALVRRHAALLERETARFFAKVVEPESGIVRRGVHFSEAQDFAVRSSSCYSNTMCHVASAALDGLGLQNPLARYDYRDLVQRLLLDGDRFLDDMSRPSYPSGDANIMPFWSGLMGRGPEAQALFSRVLARMDRDGLNSPCPGRYGVGDDPLRRMIIIDRFNPWQRDAIWTCLGIHLLETERELAPKRFAADLSTYVKLVERHRCFPEVIDARTGEPFRSPFYMSDDSMLWASSLWALLGDRGGG